METYLKPLFIQIIKELLNERKNTKHAGIFWFHSRLLCNSTCVIASVSWTRESKEWRVSLTVVSHREAHCITVFLLYTGLTTQSEAEQEVEREVTLEVTLEPAQKTHVFASRPHLFSSNGHRCRNSC